MTRDHSGVNGFRIGDLPMAERGTERPGTGAGRKRWIRPEIRTGRLFEAKCGKCDPKPDVHLIKRCRGTPPS
jgi:hypothetical protein